MMRGGNREMRRMMDKMGLDMNELQNVQEVIIKTDKKEIIISKPSVTEMKAKDSSIFTVTSIRVVFVYLRFIYGRIPYFRLQSEAVSQFGAWFFKEHIRSSYC